MNIKYIKEKIKNCFTTTGLALVILTFVANLYQANVLCLETVYQVLGACMVIEVATYLLESFESKYVLIEIAVNMFVILLILAAAGALFSWYESIPLWVLILIGCAVYLIGGLIDLFRVRNDLHAINELIEEQQITNIK